MIPVIAQPARLNRKAAETLGSPRNPAPFVPGLSAYAYQRYVSLVPASTESVGQATLMAQIENLEARLAELGILHDRAFEQNEREILMGIADGGSFEQAQRKLGEMLGFKAGKIETDASPDPWWLIKSYCFVFEDHVKAKPTSAVDATKARQAFSHPNWMRANVPESKDCEILATIVTPVKAMKTGAVPHLSKVGLWPVDDFRKWAADALAVVRELRTTFVEPGDLAWRAKAAEAFEQAGLGAQSLMGKLKCRLAADELQQVP